MSSANIFANTGEGGRSLNAVRTFRCNKIQDFLKIMVCPHGKEGKR